MSGHVLTIDWNQALTEMGAGVFQKGHFVLSSRGHCREYGNFVVPVNINHRLFELICVGLIDLLNMEIFTINRTAVLLGIGTGAFYAHQMSLKLNRSLSRDKSKRMECSFAFAVRRPDGTLTLPYDQSSLINDQAVIFVDDVFATGKTYFEVGNLIQNAGGTPMQAVFILNRALPAIDQAARQSNFISQPKCLLHKFLEIWASRETCFLCKQGMPFSTEFGKGPEEFHLHGQPPWPKE